MSAGMASGRGGKGGGKLRVKRISRRKRGRKFQRGHSRKRARMVRGRGILGQVMRARADRAGFSLRALEATEGFK